MSNIDKNLAAARNQVSRLFLGMNESEVIEAFRRDKKEKEQAENQIVEAVRASLIKLNIVAGVEYPLKTLVMKVVADNSSLFDKHSGATIAQEVECIFRKLDARTSYATRKAMISFREGSFLGRIRSRGEGSFSFVCPGMIFAIYIATTIPG